LPILAACKFLSSPDVVIRRVYSSGEIIVIM
jgi:hypothetical protein